MAGFFLFLSVVINCIFLFFLFRLFRKKQTSYLGTDKEKAWLQEFPSLKAQKEQLEKELENQKKNNEDQMKQVLEREKTNYDERLQEKEEHFKQIEEKHRSDIKAKEEQFKQNLEREKQDYNERLQEKEQYFKKTEEKHRSDIKAKEEQFKQNLEREKQDYNERLQEKEKHYEDREKYFKQLKTEFENISNKILQTNTETFQKESEKSLGHLLNPLKEEMKKFEERYDKESQQRVSLKEEISKIADKSENLTKALKGDTKAQGDWGEVVLENILKNSGLREGKDFIVQGKGLNLKSETGQNLRPDVMVNLPDNRWIVIDSKVSLTSYYNYTSAQTTEEKEACIKEIVKSLENHIDNLSSKNYHKASGLNASDFATPDFTLMFLPLEGALSLAIQKERYLFNKAWGKSIAIVSPITLYSTLKIINTLWKIDSQNKNAREIAQESGKLYDKFVGFVNDMNSIGNDLEKAQKNHGNAFKKLKSGPGNLVNKAEKIKKLGAKTDKQLPASVESYDREQ